MIAVFSCNLMFTSVRNSRGKFSEQFLTHYGVPRSMSLDRVSRNAGIDAV